MNSSNRFERLVSCLKDPGTRRLVPRKSIVLFHPRLSKLLSVSLFILLQNRPSLVRHSGTIYGALDERVGLLIDRSRYGTKRGSFVEQFTERVHLLCGGLCPPQCKGLVGHFNNQLDHTILTAADRSSRGEIRRGSCDLLTPSSGPT